jgi:hypothetical protein
MTTMTVAAAAALLRPLLSLLLLMVALTVCARLGVLLLLASASAQLAAALWQRLVLWALGLPQVAAAVAAVPTVVRVFDQSSLFFFEWARGGGQGRLLLLLLCSLAHTHAKKHHPRISGEREHTKLRVCVWKERQQ